MVARTKALTRTLYVLDLTEKRIGAPQVENYLEDRTPESEYQAAREKRANARLYSHKGREGKGRPTKKDRRDIEKLIGPDY